jgi:hypothetical protein
MGRKVFGGYGVVDRERGCRRSWEDVKKNREGGESPNM